ncbi:MAG: xanthine dehydrogenase accessory protein XdhC [Rhodobacter sp.]|nr:xanthine dehydrogenase accessory protein XdhC [Rhodobacter sp.]
MIDFEALGEAVKSHGRVARVVIADSKGSTPRERGASMLVWEEGTDGSIGGGRLEYQAVARAVELLGSRSAPDVRRQPLGPGLGQCCGGSLTLVTEIWDEPLWLEASTVASGSDSGISARRITGSTEMPGRVVKRIAALASDGEIKPAVELMDGWLLEPARTRRLPVFIYGAGHVGTALARILDPLPDVQVTVTDIRTRPACGSPGDLRLSLGRRPGEVMAGTPPDAAHFIMTHDHELDLELCHLVLDRSFFYAGLIGSETKWTRFRRRLMSLGRSEADIDRIECPIGVTGLGKHPQAIAIGTAARLMNGCKTPFGSIAAT